MQSESGMIIAVIPRTMADAGRSIGGLAMLGTGQFGFLKAGAAVAVAAVALAFAGQAAAIVVGVDQLVVYKNGTLLFNDSFDDGAAPPSAPNFNGGGAASYFEYGAVGESGGRALLYGQNPGGTQGALVVGSSQILNGPTLFNNDLIRRSYIRLLTNSNSNDLANGLKTDDDIVTMALFDLQAPTTLTTNYGLSVVDFPGLSGTSDDVLRTAVSRRTDTGIVAIRAFRADFSIPGPTLISELQGPNANLSNTQILFRQSTAANDNLVHAEFAYVNSATFDLTDQNAVNALAFQSLGSRTAFNGEEFTRVELHLNERVAMANILQMTTASPTSVSQTVSTGSNPFEMTFNYRFDTPTGTLDVILDGTVIGTYLASGAMTTNFTAASILIDLPQLDLANVDLEFRVTNPTSDPSTVALDSVFFPGLVNGDFGNGTNGWQITTSNPANVSVTTLINTAPLGVAEPATLALVGLGLAGLGLAGRLRKTA